LLFNFFTWGGLNNPSRVQTHSSEEKMGKSYSKSVFKLSGHEGHLNYMRNKNTNSSNLYIDIA
jgi:uncharacterized protein YxeA